MENKKQEFVRFEMLEIVSNDDAGESKIEEDPNLERPEEKLKLDVHVEDQEDKEGGVVSGVERKALLEIFGDGGELKIKEDLNPKKRKCELDNYEEDREDKEAGVMLGLEKKSLQEIVRVDEDDGELKLEEDVSLKESKELDDYVEDREDKKGGLALDSTSSCVEKKEVAVRKRPRLPFSSWGRRDSDSDSDDHEEDELRWKAFLERRKREGTVRELIDKDRGKAGEFTKREVDNVELQPHEYQNLHVPEEELKHCEFIAQHYADKPEPYRPMTSEEAEVYYQQLRESEGFDCPFTCSNCPSLRVKEILMGENAMKIARYSKLALLYFNDRHGTDYAFERIEKANSHSSSVATYYITFVAKSGETFQARVHEKLKGDIDVLFCRIKPGQCATA